MNKALRATCPFCGLHCADLHLRMDGGRLTRFSPRCELGRQKYARVFQNIAQGVGRSIRTEEFAQALTLLESARRLLVVVSADAPNEAVEGSLRLIRKYHGALTVEDAAVNYLNAGLKEVGGLTATLGELKEAEAVVMCAAKSRDTHPRLTVFLGRDAIEHSILFDPSDSFETIRWLRLALADEKQEIRGKDKEIVDTMRSISGGVVFCDSSILQAGEPVAREFLLWLRDLNRTGRWYAQYLPVGANSVGVAETLLSTAGIAGSLIVGEDLEETALHHWQTGKLIEEKWMDVCLFVGNLRSFGKNMVARLQGVETILVDPLQPSWKPAVWLSAAQTGVDAAGSMARLDGVPAAMEQLLDSGRLPASTILDMLAEGRMSL